MRGPRFVKDWPNLGLLSIQIERIRIDSLGSAALVDTIDDELQSGADVGAVAPMVDDLERIFQE
jgi:hypothetical protein